MQYYNLFMNKNTSSVQNLIVSMAKGLRFNLFPKPLANEMSSECDVFYISKCLLLVKRLNCLIFLSGVFMDFCVKCNDWRHCPIVW